MSHKNLGPIGSAVLMFIGYKQTNKQTNTQTDKPLYIDSFMLSLYKYMWVELEMFNSKKKIRKTEFQTYSKWMNPLTNLPFVRVCRKIILRYLISLL